MILAKEVLRWLMIQPMLSIWFKVANISGTTEIYASRVPVLSSENDKDVKFESSDVGALPNYWIKVMILSLEVSWVGVSVYHHCCSHDVSCTVWGKQGRYYRLIPSIFIFASLIWLRLRLVSVEESWTFGLSFIGLCNCSCLIFT